MINVIKTYLPNKEKYQKYIDEIYRNGWVTNDGPLVRKLEERLAEYLGVKHIVLVANGTAALEIAYRTLGLTNEVITTPFSFVATTSSLVTNGLKPVFADIDPQTLCIDPENIEKCITAQTSAIVPVHIYGNSCDIESIDAIAKKHGLKVVYDAAHAFGVEYKGKSIGAYGDITMLSFHATKLFHTIEGGALIINDEELVEKARYLINFGIEDEESIPELGINAKMNEFEAAMGLCMLDEMEGILQKREMVYKNYESAFKGVVQIPERNHQSTQNFAYFPILLKSENQLLALKKLFNDAQIFPRRYFYPSLDTLPYIEPKQQCSVSRDVSSRILALPLYPALSPKDQAEIITIVKSFQQKDSVI